MAKYRIIGDKLTISNRETFEGRNLSDCVEAAFDFCDRYGVTVTAQEIDERPDGIGNDWGGNKYLVTMMRNGLAFSLYFTDSKCNKTLGRVPTCYDVLACLEKSFEGTLGDFCGEFGYTIDNDKSYKEIDRMYQAVRRESREVRRLFGSWGDPCFEALCEIA